MSSVSLVCFVRSPCAFTPYIMLAWLRMLCTGDLHPSLIWQVTESFTLSLRTILQNLCCDHAFASVTAPHSCRGNAAAALVAAATGQGMGPAASALPPAASAGAPLGAQPALSAPVVSAAAAAPSTGSAQAGSAGSLRSRLCLPRCKTGLSALGRGKRKVT